MGILLGCSEVDQNNYFAFNGSDGNTSKIITAWPKVDRKRE